jgi:histidine triad (HIT) family protein
VTAMDCLFCKIIKGEIPSYKIYEDEYTYAFLDIANDMDGHTVVVSKKHVNNILDCDNETLFHVMETVKKIANHYVNECKYDGVNILNNNNEAAEQSVMHFHIHLIPRKNDDDFKVFPNNKNCKLTIEQAYEKFKME